MEGQFWRISDFAKEVGKHTNTVDGWFKQLEDKRVHYISRASNEKVYDDLDLQIALFIRDKRDGRPVWALEAIFDDLPNHLELRPFPADYGSTSGTQMVDMDTMRRLLMQEIASTVEEKIQAGVQEFIKQLPAPVDPVAERQQRLDEHFAQRRVLWQLEEEALHMWSTMPESERMKKVGIFRKEEDTDKRDRFVRTYIDGHYEERMKEAYRLD